MHIIHRCLIKDYEQRPTSNKLLSHSLVCHVPKDPRIVCENSLNKLCACIVRLEVGSFNVGVFVTGKSIFSTGVHKGQLFCHYLQVDIEGHMCVWVGGWGIPPLISIQCCIYLCLYFSPDSSQADRTDRHILSGNRVSLQQQLNIYFHSRHSKVSMHVIQFPSA